MVWFKTACRTHALDTRLTVPLHDAVTLLAFQLPDELVERCHRLIDSLLKGRMGAEAGGWLQQERRGSRAGWKHRVRGDGDGDGDGTAVERRIARRRRIQATASARSSSRYVV